MTEKQDGLRILRHKNKKISSIGEVVYRTNAYDSIEDDRATATAYPYGPYVEFDKKGQLAKIAVYGFPTYHHLYYSEYTMIFDPNLLWYKKFDSNGKVTETFGKEGKFELSPEMQEILKREELLPAINKALAAKKAPTLKSTLKRGTKTPRKKAGKEM